jgi:hypothetical protein
MLGTKKATWTNSQSDILSKRMSLRTHKLPSGSLKNDLVEVDKAMLQGIERPREIIFCILGFEKSDFQKVA